MDDYDFDMGKAEKFLRQKGLITGKNNKLVFIGYGKEINVNSLLEEYAALILKK